MNGWHPFRPRLPDFLKQKVPQGPLFNSAKSAIKEYELSTVCAEAKCPNRTHCFERGTLTFQILGSVCTRSCGFCAEKFGRPLPPNPGEAQKIVAAAEKLKLRHAVITSPARDDLADGGARQFAQIVKLFRKELPQVTIEILTPDFGGNIDSLQIVFESRPDIFNHNVETVRRLAPKVRSKALYNRTLFVLEKAAAFGLTVKSGFMVGHGEDRAELRETMKDLLGAGCQMLTIGQYLPPSPHHLPLQRIYTPDEFNSLKTEALKFGFIDVASGPLVRSSYHADEAAVLK